MTPRLPQKSLEGRRIRLLIINDQSPGSAPQLKAGHLGMVDQVKDGLVYVHFDNGRMVALNWAAGDRWMVTPHDAASV